MGLRTPGLKTAGDRSIHQKYSSSDESKKPSPEPELPELPPELLFPDPPVLLFPELPELLEPELPEPFDPEFPEFPELPELPEDPEDPEFELPELLLEYDPYGSV